MNTQNLIYLILVWILLNMLIPLFRNSIERLYKNQIDLSVKGSVALFGKIFLFIIRLLMTFVLTVVQISLLIIMIPTILWVPIAEKFFPRLFSIRIFSEKPFEDMRYVARIVVKPNFWEIILEPVNISKK